MKKIFYEKIDDQYVPVSEYDSNLMDGLPKGAHLLLVYPGGKSTRYNVDPNYAAMIAAGRLAEDTISTKVMEAASLRRSYKMRQQPMTAEQKAAWEHLVEVFGDEAKTLEWPSARDIAEAGVQAMQEEADKLMSNPSVRKAYERFQLVCELTKENKNETPD